MTLEVLNLICYTRHPWRRKVRIKWLLLRPYIAPSLHNYVDNCLKNTYYSFLQKQRHVGNMLLLYFYCRGFLFVQHISIPLISPITCLQIIKFYVLIQEREDKKEMWQSSLYRLNSGENISKLVDVISSSWTFNFIALVFFTKPLLYLCVPASD